MITAYIHFQGTCAEAMAFYHKVLGGDLHLMAYDEAPDFPEAAQGSGRIMHANLASDHGRLMASDFPPGMDGDPQQAVTLSINPTSVEVARDLYDQLSLGGDVVMAFGETFFSPGFGMFRDRFGTHWMISTEPTPS